MPTLICESCGRKIYATVPVELLVGEERHCPRCGAQLRMDRRGLERRQLERRQNPPDDPGPPADGERRVTERRRFQRRKGPR